MSWFGKGKSNDKARKRHVQSLMSRNGRLYTVTQQNKNSYIVSFKTRMGGNSFVILLTDQFPESAPRLYCDAKYSHPWLDAHGNIVGVDELNRWSSQYSDLGRIVQSVVMQFTASPPTVTVTQSSYKPIQPLQPTQPPSYQQHQNQKLQKTSSVLDLQTIKFSIPQKIDKLEQLSSQQIDELLKQPKLIEEFAYDVASGLREMRDQQQTEILRIARSNLAKKEEILNKDKEVNALRQEIDTLTTVCSDLKSRQDKELKKFETPRLNKELNKQIQQSDDKTVKLKETFDEGDIAPVGFIKKYIRERALYHILQIKKEKLNILFA